MTQAIQISEPAYLLLESAARKLHVTPSELAEQLIREQIGTEEQLWRPAMQRLLDQVHRRTAASNPEEIEADISAAAQEAKAERRARHRPR